MIRRRRRRGGGGGAGGGGFGGSRRRRVTHTSRMKKMRRREYAANRKFAKDSDHATLIPLKQGSYKEEKKRKMKRMGYVQIGLEDLFSERLNI